MGRSVASASVLFCAAVAILSAPIKRDVATVQADIQSIATQVTALDTSLKGLSDTSPDLTTALGINNAAIAVDASLKTAVTDAQALLASGPISDADARAILGNVVGFLPAMFSALDVIVAKKPAFGKLPINVTPLVLADLGDLYTDVIPFEAALISIAPNHVQAVGQAVTVKINSAFMTAISAFGGTATVPAPAPIISPTPIPAPPGHPGANLATVGQDIADIKTQVISLDNSINAFSSDAPTLKDALVIDGNAVALDAALQVATKDVATAVAGITVSVGEAQVIIDAVTEFKPQILDALTAIVAKKPAFAALPVSVDSLVLGDLNSLYNSVVPFEDSLVAACPDALKASAQALTSSINSAFSTALAVYGGTGGPATTKPPTSTIPTTSKPPTTVPTTTTKPPTTTTKPPTTTSKPPSSPTPTKPPSSPTPTPTVPVTCATKCTTGNFLADLFCFIKCLFGK